MPHGLLKNGVNWCIMKYDTSKETCNALKNLYEKVTEEDIYKIEDELISLDPKSFDSI